MKEMKFGVREHPLFGEDPIALITTFQLRDDAPPEQFVRLWTDVGNLMQRRPGFVSSRLYRAAVGGLTDEYIMVAHWSSARLLATAQADPEIRSVERPLLSLLVGVRRVLCEPATNTIVPHD